MVATAPPASCKPEVLSRERETREHGNKFLLSPCPLVAVAGLRLPSYPQHTVSVRYATEHRCGVVVRGAGLSDAISGTDPLKDNLPLQVGCARA